MITLQKMMVQYYTSAARFLLFQPFCLGYFT